MLQPVALLKRKCAKCFGKNAKIIARRAWTSFDRKKPGHSRPGRSIDLSDKAGQKDEPEEP